MICRQRDDGGRVPGCKLGDDDRPDVDCCYSPNWKDEDEEEENANDENEGADDADDGNNKDVVNDGETATLDYDATSCGGPAGVRCCFKQIAQELLSRIQMSWRRCHAVRD